ncbi:MAG: methionyl-tRNA formyltransferase [Candidatus Rokuibacteriota bacterium]|nr:MAG: methionyl-tRNA formyltransferase [Candidatus Rokubacteria bacterium]
MKVLFYGTPAFALPAFQAVRDAHTIVGVVTQPDRPAHRGQKLTPPAVKVAAQAAGLPVLQPARVRDPEWPERLRALGADVAVVVAFGQILPQAVLDAPARGSINIHASLLPKYRGAAPIQWAIIRGETVTGITTFQMDAGMDTGAILRMAETPIGSDETAGELSERLAPLGARVILDTLARLDTLTATPQPAEGATLAPRLKKKDGVLDWHRPARDLVNLVRGCNPWPGATAMTPSGPLAVWRARVVDGSGPPGTLVAHARTLAIATGAGAVLPVEVQPESRRAISWDDYLRGARLTAGHALAAR